MPTTPSYCSSKALLWGEAREGEQSAPVQRDTRSLFLQDRYTVLGLALSDKLRPDEEQKPWTTANSIPSPVLLNTP